MRIPGVDKAKENLVKWAAREEWEEPHAEIYATHIEPVADIVDMSGDEIAALLGDSAVMLHFFITEDFFAARFGEEDELNLIDDYLKRRGWRETVSARRYLEALRDSHVSLYEIVDIDPGRSVTVRDLILGGEAVTVNEKLGSKSLARWDRVAARIVTVNGKELFTGGILRFRHEASQELLSVFDELATRMIEKLREEAEEGSEDLPLELERCGDISFGVCRAHRYSRNTGRSTRSCGCRLPCRSFATATTRRSSSARCASRSRETRRGWPQCSTGSRRSRGWRTTRRTGPGLHRARRSTGWMGMAMTLRRLKRTTPSP